MLNVRTATDADINAMVDLESALFAEDAGAHDPYADTTWPSREGRADFENLLASDTSIVLVSVTADSVTGFLAGYWAPSSPSRLPVRYAVLRSVYVSRAHRRTGAASALIDKFTSWARSNDCIEAHVDHYTANVGAQHLYASRGFETRSISRALPL